MGSGMSNTALMGDKWDRRLCLIQYQPYVTYSDAITIRRVTIEEMPTFANSFADVFVKKMLSYRSAIFDDPKKSGKLHRYLVVETTHGFFSFDQGKRGIVVQFSCKKDDVVNKFCGELRVLPNYSSEKKRLYSEFKEILEWIISNDELNKNYNFVSNNCHHFMKRLVHKKNK